MQVPAKPAKVVPAKTVLVPPMIHRAYVPGENQKKRRQRPELVDPHPLLKLHPLLDLGGVVAGTPPLEIDDHDASVEVAGPSGGECERQGRVGPERWSEVCAEVCVTVLRCGEDGVVREWRGGELGDVVDQDEVGVKVDDTADAGGEEVGEVVAGVVERTVEGGADGGGNEASDGGVMERVDLELEVGEGRGEGGVKERRGGGGGGDEVEEDILRAG
ncbi:hypothetical protein Ahy_B05g079443 [Arachis hypogaea]|uniref:Uncharacterized protein n=1 Tax=Arachis hypogaea TaxID=3818 RepID=A0A444Z9U7_ARAHY|nr:hypothetical protein Ahy_B05g079443 [Arachis hypogaea]